LVASSSLARPTQGNNALRQRVIGVRHVTR
jgi:hypothetical protein